MHPATALILNKCETSSARELSAQFRALHKLERQKHAIHRGKATHN